MGRRFPNRHRHAFCRLLLWSLLLVQMPITGALAGESASLPAATVNEAVIGIPDFQRELGRIRRLKGGAKAVDESSLSEMKREALENLITREVLFQESVRRKISIDASTVDREMEQVKGQFASREQFAENLRRIKTDESAVREQVARGLAIRALIDRSIGEDVAVTDEEVKQYYEQHTKEFTRQPLVRLSHILATVDSASAGTGKNEAADRMAGLRKRAMAGEDFAGLATAHSDCRSKTKGGDIGWFSPGQLTPEIEKAVATLKVGEVAEIVEDRFGLHIIKVVERTAPLTPPLDDVREKATSLLLQEKGLINMQRYVKNLRNAAKVEILLQDGD